MNLLIVNCFSQIHQEASFWNEIIKSAITDILTLIGIGIAAYLAYRYALKQKRKETFIGLERLKYERKLTSLEECWKICAYMTDTENAQSILTWEQKKGEDKIYFFNKKNAEEFIKSLAGYFYGSGLGIYLSKEIKEKIFEYRHIIFGFLLSERENKENIIQMKNVEMAKQMKDIYHSLILQLKEETDLIDKIEKK